MSDVSTSNFSCRTSKANTNRTGIFFFFFFLQLLSCTSVNLKGITYSCNKNDCIQIAWFGKTAYKSSHEKRHLNSIWIFMGFYLIQCLFCLEKNSQRKKQKHLNMGGTHAVLKGNRLCFLTAMKLFIQQQFNSLYLLRKYSIVVKSALAMFRPFPLALELQRNAYNAYQQLHSSSDTLTLKVLCNTKTAEKYIH